MPRLSVDIDSDDLQRIDENIKLLNKFKLNLRKYNTRIDWIREAFDEKLERDKEKMEEHLVKHKENETDLKDIIDGVNKDITA